MKLKSIHVRHFRGFEDLNMAFHPHMTLLVGVNGAGKSSILEVVAKLLSWIPARTLNERGAGLQILDSDIQNGASFSSIEAKTENEESWKLVKSARQKLKSGESSDLGFTTKIASEILKIADSEHPAIPLFVMYPVNRAVLDIPLRIRKKHSFELFDAYEGALTGGANFRSFFEWFRNREDLENEQVRQLVEQKQGVVELKKDPQLEAVRMSISHFLPGFHDLAVQRNPLRMTIKKGDNTLLVNQLSDGEKCLLAMVGDLARRLAIANPQLSSPLEGEGIVLIDEIELHLHPKWQRFFIHKAIEVFPNCQFIISTHSPQALGEVEGNQVRLLHQDEGGKMTFSIPDQALGFDANLILEELMDAPSQNVEIDRKLHHVFQMIDDDRYPEALAAIENLRTVLNGNHPELIRAEALIHMMSTPFSHD
ncbi:MAG: AAA family ATPase [Bacteroidia bacterium]|nr:AAA family ATPase [Bacteroidia bacterium]